MISRTFGEGGGVNMWNFYFIKAKKFPLYTVHPNYFPEAQNRDIIFILISEIFFDFLIFPHYICFHFM